MKFYRTSCLLIMVLFIVSCSDKALAESENIQMKSSQINDIHNVSFSGSNLHDMLSFPSMNAFRSLHSNLEYQVELHNDEFLSNYGHLNEDALIDFEEQSGFDDELPLTEFENTYSFRSLRKHLIDKENQWLDGFSSSQTFDVSDSPYHHFIFDEEQRALLNVDAQAQIGDFLFQFTRFGYIQVPIDNLELFLAVVSDPNGSTGWLEHEDVNVVGGYYGSPEGNTEKDDFFGTGVSCKEDVDNKGQIQYTNRRKVSWRHKLRGTPLFVKAKAKTRGFKYKRGKWRCRRLQIHVSIRGEVSSSIAEEACEPYQELNEGKNRKRRKIKVKEEIIHLAGTVIRFKAIRGVTKSRHGWKSERTDRIMIDY